MKNRSDDAATFGVGWNFVTGPVQDKQIIFPFQDEWDGVFLSVLGAREEAIMNSLVCTCEEKKITVDYI